MLVASTLIMLTMSLGSYAQEAQPHRPKARQEQAGKEQRGPRPPQIPNLTEEQESQLKAFRVAHEKETLPLKNQSNELEAKLQSLMTADVIDKKEAGRVIENLSDIKAQLMKLKVDQTAAVKSILTDEQQIAFNRQLMRKKEGLPPRRR